MTKGEICIQSEYWLPDTTAPVPADASLFFNDSKSPSCASISTSIGPKHGFTKGIRILFFFLLNPMGMDFGIKMVIPLNSKFGGISYHSEQAPLTYSSTFPIVVSLRRIFAFSLLMQRAGATISYR